jgi:hypothetical protein
MNFPATNQIPAELDFSAFNTYVRQHSTDFAFFDRLVRESPERAVRVLMLKDFNAANAKAEANTRLESVRNALVSTRSALAGLADSELTIDRADNRTPQRIAISEHVYSVLDMAAGVIEATR